MGDRSDEFMTPSNFKTQSIPGQPGEWSIDREGSGIRIDVHCFEPHKVSAECAPKGKQCHDEGTPFLAWGAEWKFSVPNMTGLGAKVGMLYIRSDIVIVSLIKNNHHDIVGIDILSLPPEYIQINAAGQPPNFDQHTTYCDWDAIQRCELDSGVYDFLTLVTLTGSDNLKPFMKGPGGHHANSGKTGPSMNKEGENATNNGEGAGYKDNSGNKVAEAGSVTETEVPGYWNALMYRMDPAHCDEWGRPDRRPVAWQPEDPQPPDTGGGTPTPPDTGGEPGTPTEYSPGEHPVRVA